MSVIKRISGWVRAANVAAGLSLAPKAVVEREKTRVIAHQVGLTDEQVRELVDAWDAHYRALPIPVNEQVIRDSCVLRALGDEWQPDRMPRDWWLR